MSQPVDPLLASVQAACKTVLSHPGDAAALGAGLGAPDPEHQGSPVIKPTDPVFSLGRVSSGPDGDVRGVELTFAEPSAALGPILLAAWGPGATVPMMPGRAQKRAWTRDLGDTHKHVCMVIASLRRDDASWDDGKIETLTLRADPRP